MHVCVNGWRCDGTTSGAMSGAFRGVMSMSKNGVRSDEMSTTMSCV